MIKLIEDTFDAKTWNEKAAHPMQSWEWGEARKKTGVEVYRFGEFNGTSLKKTYQMTLHSIPITSFDIGYIPRSLTPSQEFLTFLTDFSKKRQIAFVKFEPNEGKTTEIPKPLIKSTYSLFPKWTMQLDLTKSEEQLMAGMKSKTRYNIRLGQKKGVEVKEMTNDEGFEIFIKLYFETMKRQKYFGHNYEYHKTLFNELKETCATILIAYYQGIPLSAYELFHFNNILYYPYGGSSEEHKNVMAPNLLMWETIRFGKQKKCKLFDMWGSLSPDYNPSDLWSGFTRFKEGYGGEFVQMIGTYDLVTRPLIYQAFNTAQHLRNLLMNI